MRQLQIQEMDFSILRDPHVRRAEIAMAIARGMESTHRVNGLGRPLQQLRTASSGKTAPWTLARSSREHMLEITAFDIVDRQVTVPFDFKVRIGRWDG